jgi:metal-responsive CopG/Arc/MetJ family transcriptional regulator
MVDEGTTESGDMIAWTVMVNKKMARVVDDVVNTKTFTSRTEFIRQAIREKLEHMGSDITA